MKFIDMQLFEYKMLYKENIEVSMITVCYIWNLSTFEYNKDWDFLIDIFFYNID